MDSRFLNMNATDANLTESKKQEQVASLKRLAEEDGAHLAAAARESIKKEAIATVNAAMNGDNKLPDIQEISRNAKVPSEAEYKGLAALKAMDDNVTPAIKETQQAVLASVLQQTTGAAHEELARAQALIRKKEEDKAAKERELAAKKAELERVNKQKKQDDNAAKQEEDSDKKSGLNGLKKAVKLLMIAEGAAIVMGATMDGLHRSHHYGAVNKTHIGLTPSPRFEGTPLFPQQRTQGMAGMGAPKNALVLALAGPVGPKFGAA